MIFFVKNQKCEKFWQKQWNFGYFSQKLEFLKIRRVQIFFFKNEARKLKFGLVDFLDFWLFLEICQKFWTKLAICTKFWTQLTIFQKKSNIQKSVPPIFRYHIRGTTRPNFSLLASFLKKKSVPTWFWENPDFLENTKIWPFLSKFLKYLHFYQ